MTDEQVWEDLSRFAQAMRRGATVVMNNGERYPFAELHIAMDFITIRAVGGIREIIEPPAKKIRPLNAEEWKSVAGCVLIPTNTAMPFVLVERIEQMAAEMATARATCHPPGFPNDVRKLWVEE